MKLVELEKDLNSCQEKVLESARQRIDAINEEANRLKMEILREAQAQSQSKVEEITDKVAQVCHYCFEVILIEINFVLFSWVLKIRIVV